MDILHNALNGHCRWGKDNHSRGRRLLCLYFWWRNEVSRDFLYLCLFLGCEYFYANWEVSFHHSTSSCHVCLLDKCRCGFAQIYMFYQKCYAHHKTLSSKPTDVARKNSFLSSFRYMACSSNHISVSLAHSLPLPLPLPFFFGLVSPSSSAICTVSVDRRKSQSSAIWARDVLAYQSLLWL